jgi:hypothetical protein
MFQLSRPNCREHEALPHQYIHATRPGVHVVLHFLQEQEACKVDGLPKVVITAVLTNGCSVCPIDAATVHVFYPSCRNWKPAKVDVLVTQPVGYTVVCLWISSCRVLHIDGRGVTRRLFAILNLSHVLLPSCRNWKPAKVDGLPEVFTGGWVGYAGYDTVRYVYGSE